MVAEALAAAAGARDNRREKMMHYTGDGHSRAPVICWSESVSFAIAANRIGCRGCVTRWVRSFDPPVTVQEPVITQQFDRMLRATRSIAAAHGLCRAIVIAPPADSLGMRRVQRKFFCHFESR